MRTGQFYEINISANGKHIFATDSSIRNYDEFQILHLLQLFSQKFPKAEGYEVSITTWNAGAGDPSDKVKCLIDDKWGKSSPTKMDVKRLVKHQDHLGSLMEEIPDEVYNQGNSVNT